MRKQNEGIIFNTINLLHSNIGILMYTEREYICIQREREREFPILCNFSYHILTIIRLLSVNLTFYQVFLHTYK